MEKTKVNVYLRINSNSKSEMRKQEKKAKKFCEENDMEIKYLFEDYKDGKSVETAMSYCETNDVQLLVTNDLSMISEDVYYLYDCYTYLRDYYRAGLVSVKDGFKFDFDVHLVRGEEYERRQKENCSNIH